jgi:hypothetical protein
MGLLDEAIREHLELKRRAGADAIEVARQEREALGPVVRGDPLTADLAPNQPVYDAPPQGERFEPEFYDEADDEYEDEFDEAEESLTAEHAVVPPPPPPPPPAPPGPAPPVSPYQPAPEVHDDADAGKADDDVLEQTPEFLQETPEHDRLWFEQAPPKEFDFDK